MPRPGHATCSAGRARSYVEANMLLKNMPGMTRPCQARAVAGPGQAQPTYHPCIHMHIILLKHYIE